MYVCVCMCLYACVCVCVCECACVLTCVRVIYFCVYICLYINTQYMYILVDACLYQKLVASHNSQPTDVLDRLMFKCDCVINPPDSLINQIYAISHEFS